MINDVVGEREPSGGFKKASLASEFSVCREREDFYTTRTIRCDAYTQSHHRLFKYRF